MVNLNIPIEEGIFPYTLLKYHVKLVIFKANQEAFFHILKYGCKNTIVFSLACGSMQKYIFFEITCKKIQRQLHTSNLLTVSSFPTISDSFMGLYFSTLFKKKKVRHYTSNALIVL